MDSLPPVSSKKAIGELLIKLSNVYRKKFAPEMLDGYFDGLSDLTDRELNLAYLEAIKRRKFFPTPAELRESLDIALERMPRVSEADPNCKSCDGTGWKIVEPARSADGRDADGRSGKFAVNCPCRQRKSA